jgi:hypothetical protein
MRGRVKMLGCCCLKRPTGNNFSIGYNKEFSQFSGNHKIKFQDALTVDTDVTFSNG